MGRALASLATVSVSRMPIASGNEIFRLMTEGTLSTDYLDIFELKYVTERDHSVLNELPVNVNARTREDRELLPGTRVKFLNYIDKWVDSDASGHTLLLLGQAGTGKSTIAQEVVDRYRRDDRLTSSYFFIQTRQSELHPNLLFTTIAYDLSRRYLLYKASLIDSVIRNGRGRDWLSITYKELFWILFEKPFEGLELKDRIVIVIDALPALSALCASRALRQLHTVTARTRAHIFSRTSQEIQASKQIPAITSLVA